MNLKQHSIVFEKKYPHLISSDEAKELKSLTMRDRGSMIYEFDRIQNKKQGYCLIARNKSGLLLGWALIFKGANYVMDPETGFREDDPRVRWEAHFYVRQACRRQGLGSALMKQILKGTKGQLAVHKHSNASSRFYTDCEKMSKRLRLREI